MASTRTRAASTHVSTLPIPPSSSEHSSLGECCVCQDASAPEDNPIVYCDLCNCGVHAQCYGHPLSLSIPSSSWICQSCLAPSTPSPPTCALCPAHCASFCPLKRTTASSWAHLSCALWIPEAFFRLPDGCEAIDLTHMPASRRGRRCMYCGSDEGVCGECSEGEGCGGWYHITCGMRAGILLEYKQGRDGDVVISYCHRHARKWRTRKAGKGLIGKRP